MSSIKPLVDRYANGESGTGFAVKREAVRDGRFGRPERSEWVSAQPRFFASLRTAQKSAASSSSAPLSAVSMTNFPK